MTVAIDRRLLNEVAVHGYSRPSDATGLSDAYAAWRDASAVPPEDAAWVSYDPARAGSYAHRAVAIFHGSTTVAFANTEHVCQ